jgi:hypothetical protein
MRLYYITSAAWEWFHLASHLAARLGGRELAPAKAGG